MIATALVHLAHTLNSALRREEALAEDIVVVSDLADADGTPWPGTANKLVLQVVHVELEAMPHSALPDRALPSRDEPVVALSVLVCANFHGESYAQGLKLLAAALHFLHSQPVLELAGERTALQYVDLDRAALRDIWTALGARYRPSLCYRLRIREAHP